MNAVVHAAKIGIHHSLPIVGLHLMQRRAERSDSGIVHQYVETSKFFAHVSCERTDLAARGNVISAGFGQVSCAGEFFLDGIEGRAVASDDDDASSHGGQSSGDRGTDAAASSGDDCDL